MRKSHSWPALMVTENGEVFMGSTMEKLQRTDNHSLSFNGPVAYFRDGKKTKHVSIAMLVYESFVKGDKVKKGETYDFIDNDIYNVKASNLTRASVRKNNRRPGGMEPQRTDKEYFECWQGGDSIYM